jgi:L-seryl-tRNA(Ser) seleniumtransferase
VLRALRAQADAIRAQIAEGVELGDVASAIERALPERLHRQHTPSLVSVLNATGVILHTNLGRAPLPHVAAERVAALSVGYTNLEFDLASGERGHRDVHTEALLCRLTGAEAAVVVNNTAAATMLVLAALATGREVLISRGEMIEIGGGFRVPDVLRQSGARLRELGTTNRTRIQDYAAAISDRTGLILRVHRSNFRIDGFTERAALADLAALGRRFGVPVVEDQGSGYVGFAPDLPALREEPDVRASVAAGADLVMFSGDKLLGGPQAGIVVGTAERVDPLRRHPLMRALRVGKLTCAALEATLEAMLAGHAAETVPVVAMIALPPAAIRTRASAIAARLRADGIPADVVPGHSTIGGGSAPGATLPTHLVAIGGGGLRADCLEKALRGGSPALVARIDAGRVVLDLRTVPPEQDVLVGDLLTSAVRAASGDAGRSAG